jgi:hypothetical protein
LEGVLRGKGDQAERVIPNFETGSVLELSKGIGLCRSRMPVPDFLIGDYRKPTPSLMDV